MNVWVMWILVAVAISVVIGIVGIWAEDDTDEVDE